MEVDPYLYYLSYFPNPKQYGSLFFKQLQVLYTFSPNFNYVSK